MVEGQQSGLDVCSGSGGDLRDLMSTLLSFIVGGTALGAVLAAAYNYAVDNLDFSDSGDTVLGDSELDPFKRLLGLYALMYLGAFFVDAVAGIDVTCTLPGVGSATNPGSASTSSLLILGLLLGSAETKVRQKTDLRREE